MLRCGIRSKTATVNPIIFKQNSKARKGPLISYPTYVEIRNVGATPLIKPARGFSDHQQSAQLLGGSDVVVEIIKTAVDGSNVNGNDLLHVLNLTPYEGTFELAIKSPRDQAALLARYAIGHGFSHLSLVIDILSLLRCCIRFRCLCLHTLLTILHVHVDLVSQANRAALICRNYAADNVGSFPKVRSLTVNSEVVRNKTLL
jgi:hypothetical protein